MTHTHTYAVLEVEPETFDDVRDLLDTVGYSHAFDLSERTIDMHGIAIRARVRTWRPWVSVALTVLLALAGTWCVVSGVLELLRVFGW